MFLGSTEWNRLFGCDQRGSGRLLLAPFTDLMEAFRVIKRHDAGSTRVVSCLDRLLIEFLPSFYRVFLLFFWFLKKESQPLAWLLLFFSFWLAKMAAVFIHERPTTTKKRNNCRSKVHRVELDRFSRFDNPFARVFLGSICFYGVLPSFYWVFLVFIGFYWVLPNFTGFYWFLLVFTGFYRILLGLTGFYWVFTYFYRVLPSFTRFYLVLPSFTGF